MRTAVLLNDTSVSRHVGCQLVVRQILELALRHGIDIKARCPVGTHWQALRDDMLKADICIVNGEGTIHHNSKVGLALAEAATFCKKYGKPSFLINSVCQENDAAILENLRNFDRIYVRESRSARSLLDSGIENSVVPDLTLSAVFPDPQLKRSGLIVSDSVFGHFSRDLYGIAMSGGSTYLPMQPNFRNIDMHSGMRRFVKTVRRKISFETKKRWILFFRQVLPSPQNSSLDFKARPLLKIDLDGFMDALFKHESFLTGRFHGVCLAFLAGIPFMAVASNTHKIEGMLSDAGLKNRVVSSPQGLSQADDLVPAYSSEETRRIADYLQRAREGADKMFAEIAQLSNVPRNRG